MTHQTAEFGRANGTAADERLRRELACALRWTARLNLHEATANHFSVASSDDGSEFLLNPRGLHFSEIRASDLVAVDAGIARDHDRLDPTAVAIHGAIHRRNPQVRCVLHLHAPHATAVSCLADPVLPPVDQNAMRFFERVAIDRDFDGMGLGEEAERLSRLADGQQPIVLLGNHGVIALGESVAEAFDRLYYYERACENWLKVLATGRAFRVVDDAIARRTAEQWADYPGLGHDHFNALMRILDREAPDYRL